MFLFPKKTIVSNFWWLLFKLQVYFWLQNFEDFDVANEDDTLEEFLGLPKPPKEGEEAAKPPEGQPAPGEQPTENGDVTMSEDKA